MKTKTSDELEIKHKTLRGIKLITDTKDLLSDEYIDHLKKKKEKIETSYLDLVELFIDCIGSLESVAPQLKDNNDNDFSDEVKSYLSHFQPHAIYVRALLNEFKGGSSIGDHTIRFRLEKNVETNRKHYINLINTFFLIFGGDV